MALLPIPTELSTPQRHVLDHAQVHRKLNAVVDVVADHGAVADDPASATVNAAAILAAIAAAGIGGMVTAPSGKTFWVDAKITITDTLVLWMPGTTIKQADGANLDTVLELAAGGTDDLTVRVNVDGNKANNDPVNGVLISGIQTAHADVNIGVKDCDNGVVIEGNTETNILFFDVTGCDIGVLERFVSVTSPDENTLFISGHANGTHYKKSVAAGNKTTSIVHVSCEGATAEAIIIETVDNTSHTVLSGILRGCASHGVVIDDPAGTVDFNSLLVIGNGGASTWGLRVDDIGKMSGSMRLVNFAGGAWIKKCSAGCSLQVQTSALDGPEAGVQLGDSVGATAAQRFVLMPGSDINASASTSAVHFDNALHCVAHLNFVVGLTNDVLMDGSSQKNTVIANGRAITYAKYVDLTASARDNQFIFEGEAIATFTDLDTTPSVLGYSTWLTGTSAVSITRFDHGYKGQTITIVSKGAATYVTSPGTRLVGSSADIVTAAGDVTTWVCETSGTTGSVWRLVGFVDASGDNSGGA